MDDQRIVGEGGRSLTRDEKIVHQGVLVFFILIATLCFFGAWLSLHDRDWFWLLEAAGGFSALMCVYAIRKPYFGTGEKY
jgi:hypothetical protein